MQITCSNHLFMLGGNVDQIRTSCDILHNTMIHVTVFDLYVQARSHQCQSGQV